MSKDEAEAKFLKDTMENALDDDKTLSEKTKWLTKFMEAAKLI